MTYLIDPKTKQPSVSLTMLVVTFVLALVACGLQMAKVVDNISSVMEIFYSCTALYFGRRLTVSNKSFSSDPVAELTNQIKGE